MLPISYSVIIEFAKKLIGTVKGLRRRFVL